MANFSTWVALQTAIKNQIQQYIDGEKFAVKSITAPDGVTTTYQSLGQMVNDLRRIDELALVETSGKSKHRPMFIRQAEAG